MSDTATAMRRKRERHLWVEQKEIRFHTDKEMSRSFFRSLDSRKKPNEEMVKESRGIYCSSSSYDKAV